MTYHLHTERFPNLANITARHFDGFTLSDAVGYWRGSQEASAVIEVSTDDPAAVQALAADIKRENRQESVMIEAYPTDTQFV